MKSTILLLAVFVVALNSCTTAYKTGQTPDDVYFSPARPQDEYVQVEKEDTRQYRNDDQYYDDRYLRMKVHNHTRWNDLDDWYDYERYGIRGNYYYGTYNNPYNSWNYYYNPYCNHSNVVILNSKYNANQSNPVKPRNFNLNSYTNTNYNNSNANLNLKPTTRPATSSRPVYNNSNSNGLSNVLKQIFSGSNSSNNSSNSSSTRTYTPSTSSSSSSSGSSGSSGGSSGGSVSRPARGN